MATLNADSTLKCKRCGGAFSSRIVESDRKHILVFACGHIRNQHFNASGEVSYKSTEAPKKLKSDSEDWKSTDGRFEAYQYQKDGVRFLESCGGNALIADDMGLGKTAQFLLFLRRHYDELTPTLILVKSATMVQWAREFANWTSPVPMKAIAVFNKELLIPGFQVYIMSHDLLSRKGVIEKLSRCGIKCLCVDESQAFKDEDSKRTRALIDFIQRNQISKRVFLSGTPIKSRAGEYFTILNLIDPNRFRSRAHFRDMWLDGDRIRAWRMEEFREVTAAYILRRLKEEVLVDLPPLTRDYKLVAVENASMAARYNNQLDMFTNFLNSTGGEVNSIEILAWLSKLRQTTGIAKLGAAQEWIDSFFESESEEKLTVGIHHEAVRDALHFQNPNSLKLSGENTTLEKNRIVEEFLNNSNRRLLILNMLSGGVGLNLQACNNALVLERCWTPPDEWQFEARFHRNGQTRPTFVTYLMAAGTIDQWFDELIRYKQKILGETLDGWSLQEDTATLREFAHYVAGRKL